MEKQKVIFNFEESTFEKLKEVTKDENYCSMGETVRRSLQIFISLRDQFRHGYTQVILRNPTTKRELILETGLLDPTNDEVRSFQIIQNMKSEVDAHKFLSVCGHVNHLTDSRLF